MTSSQAVTFVNARMAGGLGTLRIEGSRITAIDAQPGSTDRVLDLEGDRLLPGLINAHDHLQLNSLPALDSHRRYEHVRQWIADIAARRRNDPEFDAHARADRADRLLIGGLKNLLGGVTTVAHHDPLYPALRAPGFPTHVVARYGWSHSLYLEGDAAVRESNAGTAPECPWIIHAAEGTGPEAADEFERLDALGCLGPNTLIVHGIALNRRQRIRLDRSGAGLIWCPSSNLRLFGRTAEYRDLLARGRVGLGTDSRLSGALDLLEELCLVRERFGLNEATLEGLVTRDNARLLRLCDRGALQPGYRADLLVLPATVPLSRASRAAVRLVLTGGRVRYGDRDCARHIVGGSALMDVRVDGRPKVLESNLGARLLRATVHEPGLELPSSSSRAAS